MSQDSVLRVNGWQLFVHPEFEQYLTDLVERVTRKKKKDPGNYKQNRYYKLLKRINELIYREIPSDPNVRRYYLKKELKQLRRAKIQRYRLFFSFWSTDKRICYIWINDESSLRKAGSKSDPYLIFSQKFNFGNDDALDSINQRKKPLPPDTLP